MTKLESHIMKEYNEAYLIDDGGRESKSKDEYIINAEEGTIVAFRLNFESKQGIKLTKVISGKILDNNEEEELYVVETRNGLKYGVPYISVIWVKTGDRWPKGVYEEMKQGSVEIDPESSLEFGQIEELNSNADLEDDIEDDTEEEEEN